MGITQYIIAAFLAALICIIFTVVGKLLLNHFALKTVSAKFKKSDGMIINKTVKRAYKFGLLADLIGYLSAVIIVCAMNFGFFMPDSHLYFFRLRFLLFLWKISRQAGFV